MPSAQLNYHALVTTQAGLEDLAARLDTDREPVAIDAERASGYRYYQRAYLLQINHVKHGTWLIDPTSTSGLEPLAQSLHDREWVIHAATQDLPCLKDLGLQPDRLFDTELAGRLLGMPRVALAVMIEEFVGVKLAKQHSAADWSRRPLPETWLEYAALDVAYLVTLREKVSEALSAQNKLAWAEEEFQSLCSFQPAPKKQDPWRRLSGIHFVTNDRARALARSLWFAREQIAERTDTAPGRILSDSAILAAVKAMPGDLAALTGLKEFRTKAAQTHITAWWGAIQDAMAEPADALPARTRNTVKGPAKALAAGLKQPSDDTSSGLGRKVGPPKINAKTDPAAAERLGSARNALREISERVNVASENLLPAAALRAAVWLPARLLDSHHLAEAFSQNGARLWQIELTTQPLLKALQNPKLPTSRVSVDTADEADPDHQTMGPV